MSSAPFQTCLHLGTTPVRHCTALGPVFTLSVAKSSQYSRREVLGKSKGAKAVTLNVTGASSAHANNYKVLSNATMAAHAVAANAALAAAAASETDRAAYDGDGGGGGGSDVDDGEGGDDDGAGCAGDGGQGGHVMVAAAVETEETVQAAVETLTETVEMGTAPIEMVKVSETPTVQAAIETVEAVPAAKETAAMETASPVPAAKETAERSEAVTVGAAKETAVMASPGEERPAQAELAESATMKQTAKTLAVFLTASVATHVNAANVAVTCAALGATATAEDTATVPAAMETVEALPGTKETAAIETLPAAMETAAAPPAAKETGGSSETVAVRAAKETAVLATRGQKRPRRAGSRSSSENDSAEWHETVLREQSSKKPKYRAGRIRCCTCNCARRVPFETAFRLGWCKTPVDTDLSFYPNEKGLSAFHCDLLGEELGTDLSCTTPCGCEAWDACDCRGKPTKNLFVAALTAIATRHRTPTTADHTYAADTAIQEMSLYVGGKPRVRTKAQSTRTATDCKKDHAFWMGFVERHQSRYNSCDNAAAV